MSRPRQTTSQTAIRSMERLRQPALWLGLRDELGLSPRELDVAILLVLGNSISRIAGQLGIARGTVVVYVKRIKRKSSCPDGRRLPVALLSASGLLLGRER